MMVGEEEGIEGQVEGKGVDLMGIISQHDHQPSPRSIGKAGLIPVHNEICIVERPGCTCL